MGTRTKAPIRRERESDPMEALKPLVVLVLLGTILYGAYSVVQKGPGSGGQAALQPPASEAPPFAAPPVAAPQIEMPAAPTSSAVFAESRPPAPPAAAVPAPGAAASSPPAAVAAPGATATSAAPGIAAGVAAAGLLPATAPPDAAPTYLAAQAASPPVADTAASSPPPRPEASPLEGGVEPRTDTPAPASAAFATAWADAHVKLAAGRYAEALAVLSVWLDDPALGLEESQRLEELLGQLAGTVIYSRQDLLLPPHIVGPGETLPAIAAQLSVPWQLLAKINGVDDPAALVVGEPLKLVRGPFDAIISISRRRLSLQVGGNYAGGFPIIAGRQVQERVGSSLAVVDVRRGDPDGQPAATPVSFTGLERRGLSISLGDGLVIEAVDDLSGLGDAAPASSLVISTRDLRELVDILGPGSHVLVRR